MVVRCLRRQQSRGKGAAQGGASLLPPGCPVCPYHGPPCSSLPPRPPHAIHVPAPNCPTPSSRPSAVRDFSSPAEITALPCLKPFGGSFRIKSHHRNQLTDPFCSPDPIFPFVPSFYLSSVPLNDSWASKHVLLSLAFAPAVTCLGMSILQRPASLWQTPASWFQTPVPLLGHFRTSLQPLQWTESPFGVARTCHAVQYLLQGGSLSPSGCDSSRKGLCSTHLCIQLGRAMQTVGTQ